MRLSELQNKDIVSVDGKKIGNIIDIQLDEFGRTSALVVEKSKFLVSLFSNKGEVLIKWNEIEKIGEDVILVRISL